MMMAIEIGKVRLFIKNKTAAAEGGRRRDKFFKTKILVPGFVFGFFLRPPSSHLNPAS